MSQRGAQPGTLDTEAIFASAPFADPARARASIARMAPTIPATLLRSLGQLLREASDPDLALRYIERLLEREPPLEIIGLFQRHPAVLHYAVAVFSHSQWLGDTLLQNADLLQALSRDRHLEHARSVEEFRESFARFRSRSFEADLSLLLARFRRREYVRIMLRDVLGIATLAETTAEISALSDVLIQEALRACESELHNRYGSPQHLDREGRLVDTPFAIVSLGKLGGNELNYNSDIDLLYLYADGPDAGKMSISLHEYFIRLAQDVTTTLSRVSAEGPVFRIDLRLRPQGREGEPAIPVGEALFYYSGRARDWELQALIKARHSAGDQGLAREFLRAVQPRVYRSELNFAAIETALGSLHEMKRRSRRGIERGRAVLDVKIDRGGIRDIEFLVQCMQRVYGGREPWLRSGGTLFSLQKLHDKGHISGSDFNALNEAYTLLRRVEHRLQFRAGQQTHRLPASPAELQALYRSVTGAVGDVPADALEQELRQRMNSTSRIYGRIIHQQEFTREHQDAAGSVTESSSTSGVQLTYNQILARLASDSPQLHRLTAAAQLGTSLRKNLYRFLGAAVTSPQRYRALLDHAADVERALPVFAHSSFLTDVLVRHPEDIALLTAAPERSTPVPHDPGALRTYFRHNLLRTTARPVLDHESIWDTLAGHTATADAAIGAALNIAGAPEGFAVLALGRLGTHEFDILSDADLVFVRSGDLDSHEAARLTGRVVEVLSAYTREGTIMAVDTRLRPHGKDGELVVTPEQLRSYFQSEAQAWERLTYAKARFIAGDSRLGEAALVAVVAPQAPDTLRSELRAMRARLERSTSSPDLKLSPGGIYDLDFTVGYLALAGQKRLPAANSAARVEFLHSSGLLAPQDAATLASAAEFLRCCEHAIRLVEGRPRRWLPTGASAAASVRELVGKGVARDFAGDLDAHLRAVMAEVRRVYDSVLGR